jgi:hypothetical protein
MVVVLLWSILIVALLLAFVFIITFIQLILKKRFNHLLPYLVPFISLIGALAAVFAVLQMFQDMELRNRPYVYSETKLLGNAQNNFLSETTLKNCGSTPAFNVLVVTKMKINGEDIPCPQKETKSFTLYPNAEQYLQFTREYNDKDRIEYFIEIYYNDVFGNRYNYNGSNLFWDMGNGIYSWKTIYTQEKKE